MGQKSGILSYFFSGQVPQPAMARFHSCGVGTLWCAPSTPWKRGRAFEGAPGPSVVLVISVDGVMPGRASEVSAQQQVFLERQCPPFTGQPAPAEPPALFTSLFPRCERKHEPGPRLAPLLLLQQAPRGPAGSAGPSQSDPGVRACVVVKMQASNQTHTVAKFTREQRMRLYRWFWHT